MASQAPPSSGDFKRMLNELEFLRHASDVALEDTVALADELVAWQLRLDHNFRAELGETPTDDVLAFVQRLTTGTAAAARWAWAKDVVPSLVTRLAYETVHDGLHVSLLDVVTVLAVAGVGDIVAKGRALFRWFNFSGTGVLTELEHTVMISRVAHCFHRLHVVGSLDLTDDEARHIAMKARFREAYGKQRFIEALDIDSFLDWLMDSSSYVSTCLNIVRTLVVVLDKLHRKAVCLEEVAAWQRAHEQRHLYVPPVAALPYCEESLSTADAVFVVHRDQCGVSLAIPSTALEPGCQVVYALCEKLVPLPAAFMSGTHDSDRSVTFPDPSASPGTGVTEQTKYFRLQSSRAILLNNGDRHMGNCAMQRADIDGLDADAKYCITLYTPRRKLTPVEVDTYPVTAAESAPGRYVACVLPSSLQTQYVSEVLEGLDADVGAVVVTAPLCPIHDVVQSALLFTNNSWRGSPEEVASAFAAAVEAHYHSHWRDALKAVHEQCGADCGATDMSQHLGQVRGHSQRARQVLLASGAGPWGPGSPQGLRDTSTVAGALLKDAGMLHFRALHPRLERVHDQYASAVAPAARGVTQHAVRLVFLRQADLAPVAALGGGLTALELLADVRRSDATDPCKHLVLVLRTLADLMLPTEEWRAKAVKAPRKRPKKLSLTELMNYDDEEDEDEADGGTDAYADLLMMTAHMDTIGKNAKASAPPSAPPESAKPANPDNDVMFEALMAALTDWAAAVPGRRVTLVSTGWCDGLDLDVEVEDAKVTIEHVNLLAGATGAENDSADGFFAALEVGLGDFLSTAQKATFSSRHGSMPSSAASSRPGSTPSRPGTRVGSAENNTYTGGGTFGAFGDERQIEPWEVLILSTLGIHRRDAILKRVRASLPPGAVVVLKGATHFPRALLLSPADGDDESPVLRFAPVPDDATVAPRMDGNSHADLAPPELLHGPVVQRLTGSTASLAVSARGFGSLVCVVYELPSYADARDALSLLDAEMDKLALVGTIRLRCWSACATALTFHFEGLKAFCNYVAWARPDGADGTAAPWEAEALPSVAVFRTLSTDAGDLLSLALVPMAGRTRTADADADGAAPEGATVAPQSLLMPQTGTHDTAMASALATSQNFARTLRMLNGQLRPRALALTLTQCLPGVAHETGGAPRARSALQARAGLQQLELQRACDVTRTTAAQSEAGAGQAYTAGAHEDDALGNVHVVTNGRFCRLLPKTHSATYMDDLVDALARIETQPDVTILTVLVFEPLVRYARRAALPLAETAMTALQRRSGSFTGQRSWRGTPTPHDRARCLAFVKRFLAWKARGPGRDCVFVATVDVEAAKCATFTWTPRGVTVRQVMLPFEIGRSVEYHRAGDARRYVFPPGVQRMDRGRIEYTVGDVSEPCSPYHRVSAPAAAAIAEQAAAYGAARTPLFFAPVGGQQVAVSLPKKELYAQSVPLLRHRQGAVYMVDVAALPPAHEATEQEDPNRAVAKAAEVALGLGKTYLDPALQSYTLTASMAVSAYVDDADFLDIVMGPVIGLVTDTTATVSFEFTRDVRKLTLVLRPTPPPGQQQQASAPNDKLNTAGKSVKEPAPTQKKKKAATEVTHTVSNVEAYKPVNLKVTGLAPGCLYDLFLPDFSASRHVGTLRTVPPVPMCVQVAFTGGVPCDDLPVVDQIVSFINRQQCLDLTGVRQLLESSYDFVDGGAPFRGQGGPRSVWGQLAMDLQRWGNEPTLCVHVGPQSLLPRIFPRVAKALLEYSRRLEIPLMNAGAAGAWYFKQFEEFIRDTFRVVLMLPPVRSALSHGAHVPVYHSDYLFPYSLPTAEEMLARREEGVARAAAGSTNGQGGADGPAEKPDHAEDGNSQAGDEASAAAASEATPKLDIPSIAEREAQAAEAERYRQAAAQAERDYERDSMVMTVIRKVFGDTVQSYLPPLYDWTDEKANHVTVWRCGTVAVVVLDIVTDRRKLKKKKAKDDADDRDGDGDGDTGSVAGGGADDDDGPSEEKEIAAARARRARLKKIKVSPAFIDKNQWVALKKLSNDASVAQIVICSQTPLVPLSTRPVPTAYHPPASLPKGHIVEFAPTEDDLSMFFTFWSEWLSAKTPNVGVSARGVTLVSAAARPLATTIRDVSSGLRIMQFCVGCPSFPPTQLPPEAVDPTLPARDPPDAEPFILTGRIGGDLFEYTHSQRELDGHEFDASWVGTRDSCAKGTRRALEVGVRDLYHPTGPPTTSNRPAPEDVGLGDDELVERVLPDRAPGYGLLTFWQDTLRLSATYKYRKGGELRPMVVPGDRATLVVGPIVGPPKLQLYKPKARKLVGTENEGGITTFLVPVLVEVDRRVTLKTEVSSWLGGQPKVQTFDVPPGRPVVLDIGPLAADGRYNVRFVDGCVREARHRAFTISTHMDWAESNVAVLNCDVRPQTVQSADHVADLAARCKVPFSGITAVVHVHLEPDVDGLLAELHASHELRDGLHRAVSTGAIPALFWRQLEMAFDAIRDRFREALCRPSYREVLKSAVNVVMPSKHSVTAAEFRDLDGLRRLLHLMVATAAQEYLHALSPAMHATRTGLTAPLLAAVDGRGPCQGVELEAQTVPLFGPPLSAGAVANGRRTMLREILRVAQDGIDKSQASTPTSADVPYLRDHAFSADAALFDSLFTMTPLPPPVELTTGHVGVCATKHVPGMTLTSLHLTLAMWCFGLSPAPYVAGWAPYKSPNGKVVVEQLCMDKDMVDVRAAMNGLDGGVTPEDAANALATLDPTTAAAAAAAAVAAASPPKRPVPLPDDGVRLVILLPPPNFGSSVHPIDVAAETLREDRAAQFLDLIAADLEKQAKRERLGGRKKGQDLTDTIQMYAPEGVGWGLDPLFDGSMETAFAFQTRALKWVTSVPGRADRRVALMLPSMRAGTRVVHIQALQVATDDAPPLPIQFIDSVFHSKEMNRVRDLELRDGLRTFKDMEKLKAALAETTGRRKQEVIQTKINELNMQYQLQREEWRKTFALSNPDGYMMYECATRHVQVHEDGREVPATVLRPKVMGSVFGGSSAAEALEMELDVVGGRPAPTDYVQLPDWLTKFLPNVSGTFVHDEVLLAMRQDDSTRAALSAIEEDDILDYIESLYDKSPLRHFSRPKELREVDIERPGTLGAVLRGIIAAVWEEKIPDDVKPRVMDVTDDFVRCYCMFTTFEDYEKFGSSRRFAIAVQTLFVLACAMRWAEMARYDEEEGIWRNLATGKSPEQRAVDAAFAREMYRKEAERDAQILRDGGREDGATELTQRYERDEAKRQRRFDIKTPGYDGYDSELEELAREEEGEIMRIRLDALNQAKDEQDNEELRRLMIISGDLGDSSGGAVALGDINDIQSSNEDVQRALWVRKAFPATEDAVFDEIIYAACETIFNEDMQSMRDREEAAEFLASEKIRVPEPEMDEAGALSEAVRRLNVIALERVRVRRTTADKIAFLA